MLAASLMAVQYGCNTGNDIPSALSNPKIRCVAATFLWQTSNLPCPFLYHERASRSSLTCYVYGVIVPPFGPDPQCVQAAFSQVISCLASWPHGPRENTHEWEIHWGVMMPGISRIAVHRAEGIAMQPDMHAITKSRDHVHF